MEGTKYFPMFNIDGNGPAVCAVALFRGGVVFASKLEDHNISS
jgi:hypothetical protein